MINTQPFHLPHGEGKYSRQAHVESPYATFERELGAECFQGPSTMMYHRNPPTAWSDIKGPLRPRAWDLRGTVPSRSAAAARDVVFSDSMRMRYWIFSESTEDLFRNSDGDDLIFVQQGNGEFFCDYGHLSYNAGDYVVIPRGTMWRVETNVHCEFLMVEAINSAYALPDRGLLGPHALFDPGVLDRPKIDAAFESQVRGGHWRLVVKRHQQLTTVEYDFNPLDAVGWHGNRSVLRLKITNFRPVHADGYHVPPSVCATFVARGFILATLPPTLTATDPRAMKIPFWHNNDDVDELVFVHRGHPGGHPDLGEGTLNLAPSGITHGVYPQNIASTFETPVAKSDHYAVMIDSFSPVHIAPGMEHGEFTNYADSWRGSRVYAPDAPRLKAETVKIVALDPEPAI
jgi:homogentisate 1,2-dioxygenase